ncbi:MAG TPA: nucleoside recognition domain-containing protein [Chitinophagaceae bacterium]|nr:nucleoside recognition domain-containing protein [Chitinophagaceae bacterium]
MALNIVFIAFFLIAFLVALVRLVFFGDTGIFQAMVNGIFDNSRFAVMDICLPLIGIMAFWLGIMKVGEKGGVVRTLSKIVGPFFSKLFPEVPKDHPALGAILMNFAANMLNLDNAATPLGLKAMEELQSLNPVKDTATNAQIMFLVLNASSLTLLPINIMAYRSQLHAANPSDVFIPILIATFFSVMTGLITVSIYQRINLFNRVMLAYLGTFVLAIGGLLYYFSTIPSSRINLISSVAGNLLLVTIVILFITMGLIRKINVYDTFIEGAKEGFSIAIRIIPYLVAILVAIGLFRTSGCLDYLVQGIGSLVHLFGLNTDFVPALPVAFMKPLSGSGARGLMIEVMQKYGADSFPGRVACVIQGSTETTFYVLAVYYGAVNIKKIRHTLPCALLAEIVGIIAGICVAYVFFH